MLLKKLAFGIRRFKGLIRPFKGLIRSLKGLIRPYIGPNKGLIRPFKALIRPLKGLIRPYGSISFVSLPGNEQGGVGQQGPSIIAQKT